MKKIIYTKISFYFPVLISILMIPEILTAQWSTDPGVNTLVAGATKDQREPAVVSDRAGGVFISWRDYRYTESIFGGEIFAQRVESEGINQWAENGIQVNASAFNKGHFRPFMTADGSGGAIVVWERNSLFFYNSDIFAQRLNNKGSRIWPLNDVTIADTAGTKAFHKIISDHAGGALMVWTYLPGTPGSTDIYAQRIDSTGIVQWRKNGERICLAAESQSNPDLAWDGHGGAIIAWDDSRAGIGTVKVFAQRVDSSGKALWQTDGVEVCSFADKQGISGIIDDASGGAIIIWTYAGAPDAGLYAQRLNENGEKLWGANGIKLSDTPFDQLSCDLVSDEEGGAIVVWQDQRGAGQDIYAQRLSNDGGTLWTDKGVPVSVAANDQLAPVAIADMAGGVIIAWQDLRNDPWGDIYAQRLNGLGLPLWQINGITVCNAQGAQSPPVLATDGDEGAVFVWEDKRNETDYDIYAQRVDKNGHFGEQADQDNDGIPDLLEQGPQGIEPDYDGNGDNLPDQGQANVASFYTYDQQYYVTLAVPDSVSLENVAALDNPNPDAPGIPSGANALYGFFSFSITGLSEGSHTVATLYLENDPAISNYYKYGPVSGQADSWYDFSFNGETGAKISSDTVFLYLTDGERGDYDLTANGVIVEPGGPFQIASYVEPVRINAFSLEQNHPNPAVDNTTIVFVLPEKLTTRLEIFDITGKFILCWMNEQLPAGRHTIDLQTKDIPEGIYILRLSAGDRTISKKMVIAR